MNIKELKASKREKGLKSFFSALFVSYCIFLCVLILKEGGTDVLWILFLCIFIGLCIIAGALNTLVGYFRFDEEKMEFRTLVVRKSVFYKDIVYFGCKEGVPVSRKGRLSYFCVKTKDKSYQPDLFLRENNRDQLIELTDAMKRVNPTIVIDL